MYYYQNAEIGTFEEAKKYILSDGVMARSLIDSYLFNAFDERYLREMVVDATVDGRGLTMEYLVEDALKYMEDMSADLKEGRWELGYFTYEYEGVEE